MSTLALLFAAFNFLSSFILAIECLACTLIVSLQLHRDRKSIVFTWFVFDMGIFAVLSCIMQIFGRSPPIL
jgi:hypothetical protein